MLTLSSLTMYYFPWWRMDAVTKEELGESYLVKTRMKDYPGEALLVDPGSPENLCGDEWSERVDQESARAGRTTSSYDTLQRPMEVGGVGTGSQTATHAVTHNIVLANGKEVKYTAPQLPKSGTPALLGQKSLKRMRAIIDCYNGTMYTIGPGGYTLQLSPGSEKHNLEESHAGHLMLPCTRYDASKSGAQEAMLTSSKTAPTSSSSAAKQTSPKTKP